MLLKPRFGSRMWSGIWPPSKPAIETPERALAPLWPRPAVLPRPEPMPRPTRRRALRAPSADLIVFSSMSEHLHQVGDLVDHPAHGRGVLQFGHRVDLAQAETAHGGAMRFLGADGAAHQLHLDRLLGRHVLSPGQAVKMSSTDLPRLAATSEGVVERLSASSVARTML